MSREAILNTILLELLSEPIGEDGNPERDPLVSKEEQEEIYKRYNHEPCTNDWEYIFSPISDQRWRQKLIDLFKELRP